MKRGVNRNHPVEEHEKVYGVDRRGPSVRNLVIVSYAVYSASIILLIWWFA